MRPTFDSHCHLSDRADAAQRFAVGYGVHPWFAERVSSDWLAALERQLRDDSRAFCGECGLDKARRWRRRSSRCCCSINCARAPRVCCSNVSHRWAGAQVARNRSTGAPYDFAAQVLRSKFAPRRRRARCAPPARVRDRSAVARQLSVFKAQLALAAQLARPLSGSVGGGGGGGGDGGRSTSRGAGHVGA